ncbi:sulfurtransferase TusA family protein [Alkalicella caledoniensis]|uniref:Sulfurtransferase TusA family protein n=1 Tax=Alkalicella caledoniensis TaxID=2731377 RepID=A0A7G9W8Y7_ALKCA|nr:sulfurtransferase TusA family protein [Alkalicella caledoniensis]QNO15149.1 sulfurtransferase TusA family protein [Alkalicella caledoniensis]
MRQLDARGLSCPEPLLMFRQEVQKGGKFELTVDTNVAKENIERFCQSKRTAYNVREHSGLYTFVVGE